MWDLTQSDAFHDPSQSRLDDMWLPFPELDSGVEGGDHAWLASKEAYDAWLLFDCGLGHALVQHDRELLAGERAYLEMGCATSMRPYEIIEVDCDRGLLLRDLLEGTVQRALPRWSPDEGHPGQLLAARVFPRGPLGSPEIHEGCFLLDRAREPEVLDRIHRAQRFARRMALGQLTHRVAKATVAPLLHAMWRADLPGQHASFNSHTAG